MVDPNEHDRFVVTRRQRVMLTHSLTSVDVYEFALGDVDSPPFCFVRQPVSRSNVRVGFYADEARTVALMHLNMKPRFDPWARCELIDASSSTIGEIQKEFVPRRRRSQYVLYGSKGDEVAHVEAHVAVAVGRRRAAGVAGAAAAGVLGIPIVGAVGAAAVAPALGVGARQLRDWVDPLDLASELRVLRGDQTLGVFRRQLRPRSPGPLPPTIPAPWHPSTSIYEVDMRSDPAKLVDRRLVLAVVVALDTLRGVLPESPLR
jgi:hypothetical protein